MQSTSPKTPDQSPLLGGAQGMKIRSLNSKTSNPKADAA
jgi:hypothetical protein